MRMSVIIRQFLGFKPRLPVEPSIPDLPPLNHMLHRSKDHELWFKKTGDLWDKFVDARMLWLGDIWVDKDDPLFPRYLALRDAWRRDFIRIEEEFVKKGRAIPSNWGSKSR